MIYITKRRAFCLFSIFPALLHPFSALTTLLLHSLSSMKILSAGILSLKTRVIVSGAQLTSLTAAVHLALSAGAMAQQLTVNGPVVIDDQSAAPLLYLKGLPASGNPPGTVGASISYVDGAQGVVISRVNRQQAQWNWTVAPVSGTTDRLQMRLDNNNILTLNNPALGTGIVLDPATAGGITINGNKVLTQGDVAIASGGNLNLKAGGKYLANGEVLLSTVTGKRSVFLGGAGNTITTGECNFFGGSFAGQANTTGGANTFIGNMAGYANTTGYINTFIGNMAGHDNTTGIGNNFIGASVGYSNTTGSYNIMMGTEVGLSNTTGSYNTMFGTSAGRSNTIGSNNFFVGSNAGYWNTSGSKNIFLSGYGAGANNTTGYDNVFMSNGSGGGNTTGSFNLFIGNSSGALNNTGFYNIYLGAFADDLGGGNNSNQLIVGGHNSYYNNGFISRGYFGNGKVAAAPKDFTFNATGGYGANIAGANLTVAGGQGTGTGAGGNVILSTAPAGAVSASTSNALVERVRVDSTGKVGIGTAAPQAMLHVAGGAKFDGPILTSGPAGDIPMFQP